MKAMKRILAAVLALAMCLSLNVPALANEPAGQSGKVAITVTNADVSKEYKAYKIFSAVETSNGNTAYIASETVQRIEGFKEYFNIGARTDSGNYVTAKEGIDQEDFTEWLSTNKTSFGTAISSVPKTDADKNTVVFEVDPGYYFIDSAPGAVLTVNEAAGSVKVIDKNTQNPVIKKFKRIKLKDGTLVDQSSAAIGDEVTFQIKFTATNYVTDENRKDGAGKPVTEPITEYIITDNPDGMEYVDGSVTAKVAGEDAEGYVRVEDGVKPREKKFTIAWGTVTEDGYVANFASGSEVVLEYRARITAAVLDLDNEAAVNSATLTYNGMVTAPDKTTVNTYSFEIAKTDTENNFLKDAKFELRDAEGTLVKFSEKNGGYVYDKNGNITEITVDETAKIRGLKGGKYWLTETAAPGGYNKMEDSKEVTLGGNTVIEAVQKTADGKYEKGSVQVENSMGAELPSTGGIGTTIFYVVGGLLVVCAGILLITKKRMSRED